MITVLLPTYDSAAIIQNSIQSILRQTMREFEFLILDDGSNDNTGAVVSKIRDSRIRYIPLKHHGLPGTLNIGLKLAAHDIIARMDAGDLSAPDRFEKQFALLSSAAENTIVASHYAIFRDTCVQYVLHPAADHLSVRKRLALHPDFPHSGVMYRKTFIINNGGYRDVPFEDYDLWLRIKNIAQFHIIEENLHFVEYTSNRISTKNVYQKAVHHYTLQEPYYNDLGTEFGIFGKTEQQEMHGWREYFYGNPLLARKIWMGPPILIIGSYKILIACVFSILPEKYLMWIKESRLRFRLDYICHYYSRENRNVRKQFSSMVTF